MKKAILVVAALLTSIILSAQTQQGYVKIKGRMVDGKYIPGEGLPETTIYI